MRSLLALALLAPLPALAQEEPPAPAPRTFQVPQGC